MAAVSYGLSTLSQKSDTVAQKWDCLEPLRNILVPATGPKSISHLSRLFRLLLIIIRLARLLYFLVCVLLHNYIVCHCLLFSFLAIINILDTGYWTGLFLRQSHFCETVSLLCDSLTFLRQCGQGFFCDSLTFVRQSHFCATVSLFCDSVDRPLDLAQPELTPSYEVDRITRCRDMTTWNFPKLRGRWSVDGRQYSYFLHWCHALFFTMLAT